MSLFSSLYLATLLVISCSSTWRGKKVDHLPIEHNLLLLTLFNIFSLIHADLTVFFLYLVFLLSLFLKEPTCLTASHPYWVWRKTTAPTLPPKRTNKITMKLGRRRKTLGFFNMCEAFFKRNAGIPLYRTAQFPTLWIIRKTVFHLAVVSAHLFSVVTRQHCRLTFWKWLVEQ